jgi:hypothetical protein
MMRNRNETLALRAILPAILTAAKLPALASVKAGEVLRFDREVASIEGYDEMQGYPEYGTTGYDDGAVGAWYNPFSWGRHAPAAPPPPVMPFGGMPPWGAPRRPVMPGAPMLPPGAVQALQSGPRRLLSYMGLGTLEWLNSDTETEKTMIAEPQAAFRGRRLVIDVAKSDGATSILTTITSPLNVSGMPQTPAPNVPAPTSMFAAATTYSMLDLQIATSGTQVAMGISVFVAAGLYGEWLR